MSLVPMKLKHDMWNADVDFDLAAFHSLVRILKRTLRQLTEACVGSVLLKDVEKVKLLPPGFMCASPKKEDHLQTPALLPTFMLPRACLGIVVKFFMEYAGAPENFQGELKKKFPCCLQPVEDLKTAIKFFKVFSESVNYLVEHLGDDDLSELLQFMQIATEDLNKQKTRLGIFEQ